MDSQLNIEELHTHYNTNRGTVEAIDGISLSIEKGETVGLVGESGSGKSVTARSILQLIDSPGKIVSGEIKYNSNSMTEALEKYHPEGEEEYFDTSTGTINLTKTPESVMREIRGGEISMIFQDPMTSLNPSVPVGKQIAESLRLHQYEGQKKDTWLNAIRELLTKIRGKELSDQVIEDTIDILADVGLPDPDAQIEKYPHEFSGGMRQRVLIAIALACQPDLLIADEPTTALDVTIQAQILDIINHLQKEMGMSVLFITHDLGVVAEVCDRVAVMYAGNIVEEGPVNEIFKNPSHPYTYSLLESIPRGDKDRLTPIEGNVPGLIEIGEGCHFADRCPWAQNECHTGEIPYLQHGPDSINHKSKCILEEFDKEKYREDNNGQETQSNPSNTSVLQVDSLKKHYSQSDSIIDKWLSKEMQPVRAVDGVNLEIFEGETLGLVGESGCGKSTLGRAILQLETITEGRVVFVGEEIQDLDDSKLRKKRKGMQMIFQDPLSSLNPRMTIGDIIGDPMRVHNLSEGNSTKQARRQHVIELMEDVGLESRQYDRYPHELSGGQRQRVGIARALAVEPDFIVADEPVSSLDVSVQAQIINLLEDLQEKYGLTYLFIAHDLSVVRHIADRVAVMYLGEIVEIADVDDLFDNPKHPYTESLLSAIPTPDPEETDQDRIILQGDVPSPVSPPSGCSFHTRCPKVIPPDNVDLNQEDYRSVMEFRQQVEDRNLSIVDKEKGDHMNKNIISQDLLTQKSVKQTFWEEIFGKKIEGKDGEVIEQSFEYILNDDWSEAEEVLRNRFESVCERKDPELENNDHSASCHLVGQKDLERNQQL
jgi:peptide/nickel transport system ATP-binding protein